MYILEREKQVLEYIKKYSKCKGYAPSYSEIAKKVGISKTRVFQVLRILETKELIEIKPNTIRGIIIK